MHRTNSCFFTILLYKLKIYEIHYNKSYLFYSRICNNCKKSFIKIHKNHSFYSKYILLALLH